MPAKPNYEFAKRQKEQAKAKKKEEKRLKKLQDAANGVVSEEDGDSESADNNTAS
ncbi:MAG: hypothetical protein K0Q91_2151 [Fibrobacteria bacterium]|jgi:hypothetical protein|nr:hypothetical protein [Fibrobacteria bacterium]